MESELRSVVEEVALDAGKAAGREIAISTGEEGIQTAGRVAAQEAGEEALQTAAKKSLGVTAYEWASGGAKICYENPKTCTALVTGTGVAAYVATKNKNASEEEKKCKSICLPINWDKHIQDPKNVTIEYRKVPVVDKDGKPIGFPGDEVCQSPTKDCDVFCDKACHINRSLLGDIPFMSTIVDTLKDIFNSIFGKIGIAILVALLVLFIVSKFL